MNKINIDNWVEYSLKDLGFFIYHGVRQKQSDRKEGKVALLTAGKENQGVATYIGNPLCKYKDPISVDMFGNSFFHKGIYSGDDNIYFFINDELDDLIKLFIATVINTKTSKLYDFKTQFREPDAKNLKIKLPSKNHNQPDFEYMRSYMKNIMIESEKNIENLLKLVN